MRCNGSFVFAGLHILRELLFSLHFTFRNMTTRDTSDTVSRVVTKFFRPFSIYFGEEEGNELCVVRFERYILTWVGNALVSDVMRVTSCNNQAISKHPTS
jgi:hypothetical protein